MFKKLIINSLAFTGFSVISYNLLSITATKLSSKSEIAEGWLVGMLVRKYVGADQIESKLSEEGIKDAEDMYNIYKALN